MPLKKAKKASQVTELVEEAVVKPVESPEALLERKRKNIEFVDNAFQRFRKPIKFNAESWRKVEASQVPSTIRNKTGYSEEEFKKSWAAANCKYNRFDASKPCYRSRISGLQIIRPEPKLITVFLPMTGLGMCRDGEIIIREDAEWIKCTYNGIWLRDWLGYESDEEKDLLAAIRNPARPYVSIMQQQMMKDLYQGIARSEGGQRRNYENQLRSALDPVIRVCADPTNLTWFKRYLKLVYDENSEHIGAWDWQKYLEDVEKGIEFL